MTCEDMMEIPELNNVLNLKAGEAGLEHSIRWICRLSSVREERISDRELYTWWRICCTDQQKSYRRQQESHEPYRPYEGT